MTWVEYSALGVTTFIFLIGIAFTLLPVIPGNLLVWAGVLAHKLWLGDDSVTWKFVILAGILTLIGQVADLVLGVWGARRFGATWKGAVGAFLGAFIGFFIPPPLFWLIVGPVIGAIVGELASGRSLRDGGRAGIGTILGGIVGFAFKFGLSVCVAISFYVMLFFS